MRTMKQTLAGLLGSILLTAPATAAAQGSQGDYSYTTQPQITPPYGTVTITSYTGPGGAVTIPGTINDMPVVVINGGAFYYRANITSIVIPDSVTAVSETGFMGCMGMTSIVTGNGLRTVCNEFCQGCSSLASVTLGAHVGRLGGWAFADCTSLTDFGVSCSVTSIGPSAFQGCTRLASITIPAGVSSIELGAFAGCASLASVVLPNSLPSIEESLFEGCASLTNIVIPSGVGSIGPAAFDGCSGLLTVTIPGGVTNIAGDAFSGCTGLLAFSVDGANACYSSVDGLLFNKSQTVLLQFPPGRGGDYWIPNGVTSIADAAFAQAWSLTNVMIPASVTNIADGAFAGCPNLVAINVDAANQAYSTVDGILLDKSHTYLLQCPSTKGGSWIIPSGVTNFAEAAFQGCSNLTSVTIPGSVSYIPAQAFSGCTGLTNVTILDGVHVLRTALFEYCSGLTNLTLPASVDGLGTRVFGDCSNLVSVFFQGNAPPGADFMTFYGAYNVTLYYLPGATGWTTPFWFRPAVLWNPSIQAPAVQANGFGFDISGTTNIPIVVQAATNLSGGTWSPVESATLTNGLLHFTDRSWTNYPSRFYRISSP